MTIIRIRRGRRDRAEQKGETNRRITRWARTARKIKKTVRPTGRVDYEFTEPDDISADLQES